MVATARDVAVLAGVSVSTVSRALSRPDMVAPATRQAVAKAAAQLDYRPNPAARGLITGRTGNIGLILPDIENPFFASVIKGVQAQARHRDYAAFIADTDEDASMEAELVHHFAPQVDGLILCSPRSPDPAIRDMAALRPVILLNRSIEGLPSITIDNADGVRQALSHLWALGHRRIGYAGGPAASYSELARREAFQAAHEALPGLDRVDLGHFPPFHSGGLAAGDLALAAGVTAVLAYNDLMAVGLLERLRSRGLDLPGQMSVVGFDGIPIGAMLSPTLTTVQAPILALGRAAAGLLLTVLDQPQTAPSPHQLPVELMVRGSTGEPPRRL
ncbi:MAG: LacI family transcriptional regulator [Propionibacteriaceae bacterium]|jgi:DNA-binding LacI/PurR family transcriptional regulator|nr:LacI family transcriptional regulator [Propionibacteriaceae bacterium]